MVSPDQELSGVGSLDQSQGLTREGYERVLLYIEEKNGAKDMIAAQQANLLRAHFVDSIATAISVLCRHAIDIGWFRVNPAKGVRKIATPKEKQKPHTPWTDQAVAKMRAEARPMPRLIVELGACSGQRPRGLLLGRP